jgi:hypothetical protein
MTPPRTLAALVTAAALLGPATAAQAQPIDMHASTAQAAAEERRQQQPSGQDLRMPDRRDPASVSPSPVAPSGQDLRMPDRRGPASVSSSPVALAHQGAPSWPAHPTPLVAPAVADDGDDIAWPTIAIGVALSVLAVGALAGVAGAASRGRIRRPERIA